MLDCTHCYYCGVEFLAKSGNGDRCRSRDHLTPTSRGGQNEPANIVYACRRCNGDKGSLTLEEYRAVISLRFGTAAIFWGEGHRSIAVPAVEPAAARALKKELTAKAMPVRSVGRTRIALVTEGPRFRPVSTDDPNHKRNLGTLINGTQLIWDERPPIDPARSSESELTGTRSGSGMLVHGVFAGTGKVRFVLECSCGRFFLRTAKAVGNPLNTGDHCNASDHLYRVNTKSA